MRGWNRRRAVHRKMCDSPRSRDLSLKVRFYTESSLIRLLSVSADYYIPLRGSRRFQPQPSFFLLPTSRFYNLKAIVWKAFCHTFFLERKICKESLPGGKSPRSFPLAVLRENIRAFRERNASLFSWNEVTATIRSAIISKYWDCSAVVVILQPICCSRNDTLSCGLSFHNQVELLL